MAKICVDAMGGDHAPGMIVEGAALAARELGCEVLLAGSPQAIEPELKRLRIPPNSNGLSIIPTTEIISMSDKPRDCLRKRDSSIMVGTRLVKEGKADAFFSAGNSAAVMTAALLNLRPIPGVDRPAICCLMPTLKGMCVLIDAGANVDSTPQNLYQFAVMGNLYVHYILKKADPRVGLLSIGEEVGKGNELSKAAYELLKKSSLNFIGNVEGRDIPNGNVDVVVCDGFIGNVVLKFGESLAIALFDLIKQEISKSFIKKCAALFIKGAFRDIKKRTDYDEYGGMPLLGVDGVCIIGHGRSNAKAVKNAIRFASETVNCQILKRIAEQISPRDAAKQSSLGAA